MDGKYRFVYALLAMVVPEGAVHMTGEARDIVYRAFADLVDAGGFRMRWVEDVWVVVERVVG